MRKITLIGIIFFVFLFNSTEILGNELEKVLSYATVEKGRELLKT